MKISRAYDIRDKVLNTVLCMANEYIVRWKPTTETDFLTHGHKNEDMIETNFQEIVPISGRETNRGPGVWVWFDAMDLQSQAYDWNSSLWAGEDGIKAKKAATLKLLVCFNRMFPPTTTTDAEIWAKLEWTVTKVINTNKHEKVYATTFELSSVGELHELIFRFHRDLTHVLVIYKGPVLFHLQRVQSAREREGEGWLARERAEWSERERNAQ